MVKLYVEGGGDYEKLQRECREAFRTFLENSGLKGMMPKIVSCGGRNQAYDAFRHETSKGRIAILLVDSEKQVQPEHIDNPWAHLKSFENWDWLNNLDDDKCHLMAQCMESWFFADKEALRQYYGQGFNIRALSNNSLETIDKAAALAQLMSATRTCKKGTYQKGRDSFKILMTIDPVKVTNASNWAKRFIECLKVVMQP